MVPFTNLHSQLHLNLSTLVFIDNGGKFIIEESNKNDATRHIGDAALYIIAGVVLFGFYLMFILPEISLFRNYFGVSLSVAMVGIALSLYAFATRGFKPQVGFDSVKERFWICKLNSRGHARIVTYFPRTDVQSVFIRRPESPSKEATLCARIQGKLGPITLLRGRLDDIEVAHRELCGQLRNVDIRLPVKPVLRVNSGGVRLMADFRANAG